MRHAVRRVSRIYFHAEDADAEVRGAERAHCGVLVSDIFLMALHIKYPSDVDRYLPFLPPDCYVRTAHDHHRTASLSAWLTVGSSPLTVDGEQWDTFRLALNTAVACGGPLRLAAYIHGQCEIHGWVDGHNRSWLADQIEEARAANIFRSDMGWESVVTLLRSSDEGPVVTSYSVCDGFPNPGICKDAGLWAPGPGHQGVYSEETYPDYPDSWGKPWWDGDEWYELPDDERWSMGVRALRVSAPEWSPSGWGRLFGNGKSGWDLAEIAARA